MSWWFVSVLCALAAPAEGGAGPVSSPSSSVPGPGKLEAVLVAELDRSVSALGAAEHPPHYVSLAVQDIEQVMVSARDGTLAADTTERARYLDVDLRTGTPELDSTHPLRGFSALADDTRGPVPLPLTDGYALEHAVWAEIDSRYRNAAERIVVLRANQNVKVEEEDPAPDFEAREAVVDRHEVPPLEIDGEAWAGVLTALSTRIDQGPTVHRSAVTLQGDRLVTTFVDTEGTRLQHGRLHLRVSMQLATVAPDGDEVSVYASKDVRDPTHLPTSAELEGWADEAVAQLDARVAAPRADPYSGPVLLTGRAAAVFFHEVLGHRVEGHRQKREDEGKTFADQVGHQVLPRWLDVLDDPRLEQLAGEDLNGAYAYDDEGVPAQEAVIVDDGTFRGFLLYRSPIPGFPTSNGHGRRSTGNAAEARMGNTLVRAKDGLSDSALRQRMLGLVRAQGLAYGYIVDEIEGGFTLTGRVTPNAFNVRASTTWRVYADGRPDELVRGIDLVGTPLVAFSNIVAAGNEPAVFNGVCGSDSGWVPVSAVAPAILFDRLEFQLKEKGQDRPPLMVKPALSDGSADGGAP